MCEKLSYRFSSSYSNGGKGTCNLSYRIEFSGIDKNGSRYNIEIENIKYKAVKI